MVIKILNPYQCDRCRRIAGKDGFDKCQEALYDTCETVITAVEGDSWDELVRNLAGLTVAIEKIRSNLDLEYQKKYYSELEEEIRRQTKARNLICRKNLKCKFFAVFNGF